MGFNTPVVFHNDDLHRLESDADAGQRISMAIKQADLHRKECGNLVFASDMRYGRVFEPYHADQVRLLAIGGNTGVQLASYFQKLPVNDDEAVKLLKKTAATFGYRLVKKK